MNHIVVIPWHVGIHALYLYNLELHTSYLFTFPLCLALTEVAKPETHLVCPWKTSPGFTINIGWCQTINYILLYPSLPLVPSPSSSCTNHWFFSRCRVCHYPTWCKLFCNVPAFLLQDDLPPLVLFNLFRLHLADFNFWDSWEHVPHVCESSRCCDCQTCWLCVVYLCGLVSTWLFTQHVSLFLHFPTAVSLLFLTFITTLLLLNCNLKVHSEKKNCLILP